MSQVEIEDATKDFVALVRRVRGGEDVELAEGGRVVAKIVAVDRPERRVRLGLARGAFKVPDDFDAPLPDDVLALFYESPLFPGGPQPDDKP